MNTAIAMNTTTNEITIKSVDRRGVTTSRGFVSWPELRSAARNVAAEVAAVYSKLLEDAEAAAAERSPILLSVEQDHTNVWWVVRARALWGGGHARFRRLADEGGTFAQRHWAESQARDIAERLQADGRDVRIVSPEEAESLIFGWQ